MKFLKKLLVVLLVLALCAGIAFATFKYCEKNLEPVRVEVPVESIKIVEKEIRLTEETVESGLKDMGKLCTAEYYFTHVSHYDSSKTLPFKETNIKIPLTKSSFVYSYDGVIIAGIDFSKIKVAFDEDAKTITLTLPETEVISSEIDTESFKLYDEKTSAFNPIHVTDVTESIDSMIKDELQKAEKNGLFEKAESNAELILSNFIKGLPCGNEYKVLFAEPQE